MHVKSGREATENVEEEEPCLATAKRKKMVSTPKLRSRGPPSGAPVADTIGLQIDQLDTTGAMPPNSSSEPAEHIL